MLLFVIPAEPAFPEDVAMTMLHTTLFHLCSVDNKLPNDLNFILPAYFLTKLPFLGMLFVIESGLQCKRER